MKTCIAIALLGLTVSAWAQNVVYFQNVGSVFPTPADRRVYRDHVGGFPLVGTNHVAGLWFVPGDDAASVDGRISPERGRQTGGTYTFRIPVTAVPGTWLVNSFTSFILTLDRLSSGEVATLHVRGWDS